MQAHDIRALSSEEIMVKLRDVQEELFNLRFQLTIGQLENHSRITQLKRDVARLKTILRERELVVEAE
jgi:large subunit ribosomal protein L29